MSQPSTDAGKFIVMNCDPDAANVYQIDENTKTIKIGLVTKKNCVLRKQDGSAEYAPIVKWSNEIKKADIKSYSFRTFAEDTEDTVEINFAGLDTTTANLFKEGGKRIIVRLTFKDMPHRYRKWTESYEYVTVAGEEVNDMVNGIANMINREYKRARVQATANGSKLVLEALPYDDDDSVDSLSWANKVRFNANIYYTNPAAEGWDANNKYFPKGVEVVKTPGVQYPASAKLVRDRESWAMGYQGILNRGEGTWPIIKPDMETNLGGKYDAITLEFENMYRAADDIQRKTKQVVEIYCETGNKINGIKNIIDTFVATASSADAAQTSGINQNASNIASINNSIASLDSSIADLNSRIAALETAEAGASEGTDTGDGNQLP